jgi:hypothetical protein
MKHYPWFLALSLWLGLVPGITAADPSHGRPQAGSAGGTLAPEASADELDLDISWYSINSGGDASSNDDVWLDASIGQAVAGDACVYARTSLQCGFWAPDSLDTGDPGSGAGPALLLPESIAGGIVVRLQCGYLAQLTEVILERSASAEGPWVNVPFERHDEGTQLIMIDTGATSDRTWYYRVRTATPEGDVRTFGPAVISSSMAVTQFSLLPISPNPSHGLATIWWTVPRAAAVRLTVHDVQGRQVATLADGLHAPGRYNVSWNLSSGHAALSAGMYFVRLQTPDGAFVRRVVMTP